ncbi:hypothetical protein [Winogradskyella sp. PC D3.3]
MKNFTLFFVLLLMLNCTTDTSDVQDPFADLSPQTLNCVDDLPQVRITNNGTMSYDIVIYGQDYSELYTQSLSTTNDTDWQALSNNDIIVVASNVNSNGQKMQLNLLPCDAIEIEIDTNNALMISDE